MTAIEELEMDHMNQVLHDTLIGEKFVHKQFSHVYDEYCTEHRKSVAEKKTTRQMEG